MLISTFRVVVRRSGENETRSSYGGERDRLLAHLGESHLDDDVITMTYKVVVATKD